MAGGPHAWQEQGPSNPRGQPLSRWDQTPSSLWKMTRRGRGTPVCGTPSFPRTRLCRVGSGHHSAEGNTIGGTDTCLVCKPSILRLPLVGTAKMSVRGSHRMAACDRQSGCTCFPSCRKEAPQAGCPETVDVLAGSSGAGVLTPRCGQGHTPSKDSKGGSLLGSGGGFWARGCTARMSDGFLCSHMVFFPVCPLPRHTGEQRLSPVPQECY